jgi:hypothetical protein
MKANIHNEILFFLAIDILVLSGHFSDDDVTVVVKHL